MIWNHITRFFWQNMKDDNNNENDFIAMKQHHLYSVYRNRKKTPFHLLKKQVECTMHNENKWELFMMMRAGSFSLWALVSITKSNHQNRVQRNSASNSATFMIYSYVPKCNACLRYVSNTEKETCICKHKFRHTYTYIYTHTCKHTHTHIHINIHTYIHICC